MSQSDLYPCQRIPDHASDAKLIGLYRQKQEDLWLQRVKMPGGRLTANRWRALAEIARRVTPQTPLHLTTRQDIEIHDLPAEQVPLVQAALNEAGLTCFGAAGDTFRNITVCPCSGTAPGTVELMGVAQKIQDTLAAVDGIYALPRKFKI
jgi:sulfite reductase beta subunit-like hemoprotein